MVFVTHVIISKSKKKFGTLHDFACHPCAGAMLIFSVSFQFYHTVDRRLPKVMGNAFLFIPVIRWVQESYGLSQIHLYFQLRFYYVSKVIMENIVVHVFNFS